MTYLALVGASLQAFGHPNFACSEPAPGNVVGSSTVSIDETDIGVKQDSSMDFPSHGHDTDDNGNCINYSAHSIQPDDRGLSDTLTVNGNPMYLEIVNAGTDPITSQNVDYADNGGNGSVQTIE